MRALGETEAGVSVMNNVNFPDGDVDISGADTIFEVANPFPFRGTTFIARRWADHAARNPSCIAIDPPQPVSIHTAIEKANGSKAAVKKIFSHLPDPIKMAVATTSTDPEDLKLLADSCCRMVYNRATGQPTGLIYKQDANGEPKPCITNAPLYEAVANNPHLADTYKEVMVLRPGIQGDSPIIGQWRQGPSHVYEYLRRNSYIPWGHYAANMADDAIRYHVGDLSQEDTFGLRHLYYQRTYVRMAAALGLPPPPSRKTISQDRLEVMRQALSEAVKKSSTLPFSATLWGWNYGFDYAPSGYRLNASHQQIHQQYALIPDAVPQGDDAEVPYPAFACGNMIESFIQRYRRKTGQSFFRCYEQAVRANRRMDGHASYLSDLVVYEDDRVILFVPKAQTSQWELQLMPLKPVGNILETDTAMRRSLDLAIWVAMRALSGLGASMITVFEYSKRFHSSENDQRLLYCFLPRLPESPGAFSESQLRWINGHYPEDFAAACRLQATAAEKDFSASL